MFDRRIKREREYFEISFDYNRKLAWAALKLPGVEKVRGSYIVPVAHEPAVIQFAMMYDFSLDFTVEKTEERKPRPLPELEISIPLKRELYPFQRQGVAYCIDKKRVIIGDSMGLGKTCQAIATVVALDAFPCLVICPASLKFNWQREWHAWTDNKAVILNDVNRSSWHLLATGESLFGKTIKNDIFITNYESLDKFFVKSRPARCMLKDIIFDERIKLFKSVIIDEAHRVKDPSALQSKITRGIARGKEVILAITGTPVVNKAKDLASPLAIIETINHFGGYSKFIREYGFNDNLSRLQHLLTEVCFYARNKKDVLPDLPEKIRSTISCQITNREEYNTAATELDTYLRDYRNATEDRVRRAMRNEVLVKIGALKNISARGKLQAACEFIDDFMEGGGKLVVFVHLREVAAALLSRYPGSVSVTGADDESSRQRAVDAFQTDPGVKIIICSMTAAGVGLTLTAAYAELFVEQPWTAAAMDQCEDRLHRIGQKNSVYSINLVGSGTIDEHVMEVIDYKREIANQVTGGKNEASQMEQDLLINKLMNK